jgi:hypothetical protein
MSNLNRCCCGRDVSRGQVKSRLRDRADQEPTLNIVYSKSAADEKRRPFLRDACQEKKKLKKLRGGGGGGRTACECCSNPNIKFLTRRRKRAFLFFFLPLELRLTCLAAANEPANLLRVSKVVAAPQEDYCSPKERERGMCALKSSHFSPPDTF